MFEERPVMYTMANVSDSAHDTATDQSDDNDTDDLAGETPGASSFPETPTPASKSSQAKHGSSSPRSRRTLNSPALRVSQTSPQTPSRRISNISSASTTPKSSEPSHQAQPKGQNKKRTFSDTVSPRSTGSSASKKVRFNTPRTDKKSGK